MMPKPLLVLAALTIAACGQVGEQELTLGTENPAESLLPWNSDRVEVRKTGTGLEYVVVVSGDPGNPPVEPGNLVTVHYDGLLADGGKRFDSSREREEPATFPADALIPGWVEALQLMRPGDRWVLYIPYRLAYGERGRPPVVPEAADLIFDVELIAVDDNSG